MNTFIRSFVPFYSISILSTPSVPSFNGSNPSTNNPAFKEYYYLTLRKVIVDGNGGTIVDTGSTFTFMERPVCNLVAQEFVKQMDKNYSRTLRPNLD